MRSKLPWREALSVAEEVMQHLSEEWVRCEIVGSVRRRKDTVGDVELLLEPKPYVRQATLTAGGKPAEVRYHHRDAVSHQMMLGILRTAPDVRNGDRVQKAPFGERYQRVVHAQTGISVDLFWVFPPAQWGLQQLIRTGPVAFSKEYVTQLHRFGLQAKYGRVIEKQGGAVVDTPDEKSALALVEWPYIAPNKRDGWIRGMMQRKEREKR